jgi:hypothetical protein
MLWGGCVLFTPSINMAPTVSIVAPQTLGINMALTFKADVHDEHVDSLRFAWGLVNDKCPDDGSVPADPTIVTSTIATLTTPPLGSGLFCVFVTVTDDQGASDHRTQGFEIQDPPLGVAIGLDSISTRATDLPANIGVPLFADLQAHATVSGGPAGGPSPSIVWTLTPPNRPGMMRLPCTDLDEAQVCFPVDESGTWTLAVTAKAGSLTASAMLPILVAPDQPPCIPSGLSTDPPAVDGLTQSPNKEMTFTVLDVSDDGDPWPPLPGQTSMLTFEWWWRLHGDTNFQRMVSPNSEKFSFAAGTFTDGALVDVLVEAVDRQQVNETPPDFTACSGAVDRCSVHQACSHWIAWKVMVQ